jgi:hypothetical protein
MTLATPLSHQRGLLLRCQLPATHCHSAVAVPPPSGSELLKFGPKTPTTKNSLPPIETDATAYHRWLAPLAGPIGWPPLAGTSTNMLAIPLAQQRYPFLRCQLPAPPLPPCSSGGSKPPGSELLTFRPNTPTTKSSLPPIETDATAYHRWLAPLAGLNTPTAPASQMTPHQSAAR